MSHSNKARILLLMSGSIACAKASSLISEWTRRGHEVKVACTRSVAAFIGPSTLQGLGAGMVFDDVFAPGQAMEHISLSRWADIVIAAPATSNLINKLAAGIADDAVTTLWQAAYGQGKPMLIVPAMNTRMWRYPATQESVERLKRWSIHVLKVGKGELACGEHGEGRMPEPTEILDSVERLLSVEHSSSGKRILITAGGTREPIDSVRYIGNLSSGRTASMLTNDLATAGHRLTWLGAEDAIEPVSADRVERFRSFQDLQHQLQILLGAGDYDVVIHAAAVSDFSVACVEAAAGVAVAAGEAKLSSESDLVLHLKRNPKLLGQLKSWSGNPGLHVIGFKLTHTEDLQQRMAAVKKQFAQSQVDAVVHNDLLDISQAAHPFHLHAPAREPVRCADNRALAKIINKHLEMLV